MKIPLTSWNLNFWVKSFWNKWVWRVQLSFSLQQKPHSPALRCTSNIKYTHLLAEQLVSLEKEKKKEDRRRALLCCLSKQPVRKRQVSCDPKHLPAGKGSYVERTPFIWRGLWLVSQWEGCETFPWHLSQNYSLCRAGESHLKAVVPSPTERLEWCGFHISRLIDFQRERLCDFIWRSREICSLVYCCHFSPFNAYMDRHLIGLPVGTVMMIWNVFTFSIWNHLVIIRKEGQNKDTWNSLRSKKSVKLHNVVKHSEIYPWHFPKNHSLHLFLCCTVLIKTHDVKCKDEKNSEEVLWTDHESYLFSIWPIFFRK